MMMTAYHEQLRTAAQAAAALVLGLAPLVRGRALLPTYTQPAITWHVTPACDPAFAAAMRAVWARLDLRNRQQFSEAEALVLRAMRMHGLGTLYQWSLSAADRLQPAGWHRQRAADVACMLGTIVGDALFALLTPAERAQWLPVHGCEIRPGRGGRTFEILCDSLGVVEWGDGQRAYYSALRPTVLLQGRRLPIAFTAHALARLQARGTPAIDSYDSWHDRFAMVAYQNYADPAAVYPDQPAFSLFDTCMPGFLTEHYVLALQDVLPPAPRYAYRLGYCPSVQAAGFHVAKTLLVPGFIGTPEYSVLLRTSLDAALKQRLLAQCEELSADRLAQTLDLGLMRWFHQHGIPQVMPAPPDLFVYPS
jgi:hypothetical protein